MAGTGCELEIKLITRESPCIVDYYPPTEKPTFPTPGGYIGKSRFTDNLNGTVTDNETGLIWLKNANCVIKGAPGLGSKKLLVDAFVLAGTLRGPRGNNLGKCNLVGNDVNKLGDWRLPEIDELHDMLSYVQNNYQNVVMEQEIFNRVQFWKYWSATNKTNDSDNAWLFNMEDGQKSYESEYTTYHVWPVHPRFTDNSNGTVTDNHTGLIWLKNTTCLTQQTWQDANSQVQSLSQGQCGLSDKSVSGDWRLPSDIELRQLMRWRSTVDKAFAQPLASYWSNTFSTDIPNAINAMQVTDVVIFVEADKEFDPETHYSWAIRSRRPTECVGTKYLEFYDDQLPAPCDDKDTDWEQSVFEQWDRFR